MVFFQLISMSCASNIKLIHDLVYRCCRGIGVNFSELVNTAGTSAGECAKSLDFSTLWTMVLELLHKAGLL